MLGKAGTGSMKAAVTIAGVLVALLFVVLPASAPAATIGGLGLAGNGSQAAMANSGKIPVEFAVSGVKGNSYLAKVAVSVKQPWSKKVEVEGGQFRKYQAKARTSEARVSLAGSTALDLVRNCGTPTVTVVVTVRADGRTTTRRASVKVRPSASLCAVPEPVKAALARSSENGCDFIAPTGNACLAPFPNDFYTRSDPGSETGRRLDLDPEATPENVYGDKVDVTEMNRSDGFSPGSMLTVFIPGLDNQEAFDESGLVPLWEMSKTWEPDQAAVLIDAETGERQLIWAEMDSTAPSDATRHLLIRVGKNLENGKRYIVALRNLRNAEGDLLAAPAGFRLYRDGRRTKNSAIERRRGRFESIFRTLSREGVERDSLYLAWDFTVASTENLTGRMLSIRDRAFQSLGDEDLMADEGSDGVADGEAPEFTVTKIVDGPDDDPEWISENYDNEVIRMVRGRFTVPCYLWTDENTPGCNSGARFKLDGDQKPIRGEGSSYEAKFFCNIPDSALTNGEVTPVEPAMYGHGLFGSGQEIQWSKAVRQVGDDHGVIVCAADWIGMAAEDVPGVAIPGLQDLSKFPALPDRLQQGFLNFLMLGRLLVHPDGFASHPAFQVDPDEGGPAEPESVIDPTDLFYFGNSQGGIAGGALTAVATDFTRSVLYVGGINYSILLSRSSNWPIYGSILYGSYTERRDRPVLFSIMQTMWDRGEPNGYANQMTDDPLPGTPEHKVMYVMAYGDFQVPNVGTEVAARTIGAPLRLPAVAPERLTPGLIEPFYGHETLGDLATSADARNGNALFVWDIGPKRLVEGRVAGVEPPPITNLAPDPATAGLDPHDRVIDNSPIFREQMIEFLRAPGRVTDPCTGNGTTPYCTAVGWQGMP